MTDRRSELDLAIKKTLGELAGFTGTDDFLGRPLIVTMHRACYKDVSSIVVSVNGSPPKGEMWIHVSGGMVHEIFLNAPYGTCRRLRHPITCGKETKSGFAKKTNLLWGLAQALVKTLDRRTHETAS